MLDFYRTYTTPFKEKISTSVDDFFRRVPLYKRFKRFFGRWLYTKIRLRNSKKIDKILPSHQKILWVQWVDSYLGDSLTDLSSRILLKDKQIDLLTKNNVAKIYQNDRIFNKIFTNSSHCDKDYDLIIIGSYRQREIKILTKSMLLTPHISVYGYYNVDDFNRLYFSFFRINQLLSQPYNEQHINDIAKPLLPIISEDKKNVKKFNLPNKFITIAIGGANIERTFNNWQEVVSKILSSNSKQNIVLVGLQNTKNIANDICKKYPDNVLNMIGKFSFNQTAEVINQSKILICCDGGLLHAANAVKTPVVALFYYIDPMMKLIKINSSKALMDKKDINNISVDKIIEQFGLLKART